MTIKSNVYSYDPKDGQRSAKTVDATEGYQDPQRGQNFFLMINQTICINGLENHLLCLMQCHLKCVHNSKVPKFLVESPSVTTHAIELVDPFNTTHLLIIPLHLSGVTSYFDVNTSSITEYKDEDIPKIYLTAEEPRWDPSANEYSERKT